MSKAIALIGSTVCAFNADKAPRLAAAIAFTTIFSIAPLLIITIAIAGQVLGFTQSPHPHTRIENTLLLHVERAAGRDAAIAVRSMVDASFGKARAGIVAQTIGWITFLIGASGVFAAVQDALNTVWHVEPAKRPLWITIRDRVASLGMLLAIGFLLLVSFLASAAIAFVSNNLASALPFAGAGVAFAVANWIVSFAVISALFAMMYKFLPDATVEWRDVWAGAGATALLFVIGQTLIGWYLGFAGTASAYGVAGAFLALLLWIYYSAMVLLFGAEFTRVFASSRGEGIAPSVATPGPEQTPA